MSLASIIGMISILTLVWGGFGFFLSKAIRKERAKKAAEPKS